MADLYVQNKEVIQSRIGDEVVMLDVDSGFYFGLNSVASDIWTILKDEIDFDSLIVELMNKYFVDKGQCENETKILLDQMLKLKIIRKV